MPEARLEVVERTVCRRGHGGARRLENFKYCMSMLNAIWFSALRIWVEGGCKESPAEVYEIAKRNLEAVCERL